MLNKDREFACSMLGVCSKEKGMVETLVIAMNPEGLVDKSEHAARALGISSSSIPSNNAFIKVAFF